MKDKGMKMVSYQRRMKVPNNVILNWAWAKKKL